MSIWIVYDVEGNEVVNQIKNPPERVDFRQVIKTFNDMSNKTGVSEAYETTVGERQKERERFTMKIVLIKESKSYCVYRNGEKIGWFVELSNVLDLVAMEIKDALDD